MMKVNEPYGSIRVFVDLNYVKQVLMREGFYDPGFLQWKKEGQVFGLVKRISKEFEVHVRGYDDNTLDAEIEISRDYLQHPFYGSNPCYDYLINILVKYNIPYQVVRPLPRCPTSLNVPKGLIPWRPIAGFLGLVGTFFFFRRLSGKL